MSKFKLQEEIDRIIIEKLKLTPCAEVYRYLFSQDMELFGKYYFSHVIHKPNSLLHKWLYDNTVQILNKPRGKGIRLAVAAPRGNAKSSLMSFILPIWCVCFERKKFIILVSETQDQANDFLDDIKSELTSNELLIKHFPRATGKNDERWRQDDIITRNDIRVKAVGCQGKMRGRTHRKTRPDLILLDDVESRESVDSDTTRIKLRTHWFDKEVLECGDTEGTTDFIVVGTILHEDSLLNNLLKNTVYQGWKREKFKAVIKFADAEELWAQWRNIFFEHEDEEEAPDVAYEFFKQREKEMLEGVEVLWPEGETYYDLMCRTLTPDSYSAFLSEKQNQPIDLTKVKVTKDELWYYKSEEVDKSKWTWFGAWDPSKGKKSKRGDYSAVVALGRDKKTGIIYVDVIDLKRHQIDQRIDEILLYHQKLNFNMFAVETIAFQEVVKESLAKKSQQTGVYLPIADEKDFTDKELRIDGLVPFILDGTIRFKDPSEWSREYAEGINQLVGYGAGATYDDFPDALQMAFKVIKKGKFIRQALVHGRTITIGVKR